MQMCSERISRQLPAHTYLFEWLRVADKWKLQDLAARVIIQLLGIVAGGGHPPARQVMEAIPSMDKSTLLLFIQTLLWVLIHECYDSRDGVVNWADASSCKAPGDILKDISL
jgi:hypothetical protein